jgi:nucleotide-binding universal stress UspA family protein
LGTTSAQADDALDTEEIRAKAAEMAGDAVSDIEMPYRTVGVMGAPASAIVEYADDQDARYIVVSPRRRSRTGKVLFGSVAQDILLEANCPVVTQTKQAAEVG